MDKLIPEKLIPEKFKLIPQKFLSDWLYTISVIPEEDIYTQAYSILLSWKNNIPEFFQDWLRAQTMQVGISPNLFIDINETSSSKLSSALSLPSNDLNRLVRFLIYMGITPAISKYKDLPFVNDLPEDIQGKIFLDIDCNDIINFCQTNRNLQSFCTKRRIIKILNDKIISNGYPFNTDGYNINELLILCNKSMNEENVSIIDEIDNYFLSELYIWDKNNPLLVEYNVIKIISITNFLIVLSRSGKVNIYKKSNMSVVQLKIEAIVDINEDFDGYNSKDYIWCINNKGILYHYNISNNLFTIVSSLTERQQVQLLIPTINKIRQYVPIIQVSAEYENLFTILSSSGNMYVFPCNNIGCSIINLNSLPNLKCELRKPYIISYINNIVEIAAGYDHILAIDRYGTMYALGYNDHSQLGKPPSNLVDLVTHKLEEKIIHVSAGYKFSACLTLSGKVYVFGDNISGLEMGFIRNFAFITKPTLLKYENIVKVSVPRGLLWDINGKMIRAFKVYPR